MSAKKTEKHGNKATVPTVLIARLFQLVFERKFAEAERMLERVITKMEKNENDEFNSGYFQAIRGIILSSRSGSDPDTLLNSISNGSSEQLKRYHKEFSSNAENRLHGGFDRGYFAALSDYVRVVLRSNQNK